MPQILADLERYTLQYLRDKPIGTVTPESFKQDFEDIDEETSARMIRSVITLGFAEQRDGVLYITQAGDNALDGV